MNTVNQLTKVKKRTVRVGRERQYIKERQSVVLDEQGLRQVHLEVTLSSTPIPPFAVPLTNAN